MAFPPVLSDAENLALLIEAKNGSKEAKELFFAHNMRLMTFKAMQYINSGFEFEDLISASQLGFLKAYERFDLTREIKFVSYACKCIENEIGDYIRANQRHRKKTYLDEPRGFGEDGDLTTLRDSLVQPGDPSLALVERDALQQCLEAFKQQASSRECLILTLRFEKEWGQAEIAERVGVSQVHVSRIIKKLLSQIRIIKERQSK